jgi:hypothetical protein
MSGVSKHSEHYAAGAGMRRARSAAWIVTLVMGGTTMAFQVYHAVKFGHMPWELAVLYGIVPLLIALLVLEIVAEWREAPWPAKAAAYAIMAAAMFLSASATGSVVLHAAPGHFSLLPGALLDAAELLAAFFIMNGPTAAHAVAEVARRIEGLVAEANAARRSREETEANAARTERELRAAHEAELRTEREAHEQANARVTGELDKARETERREANARTAAETELAAARVKLAAFRAGQEGAESGRLTAEAAREEEASRAERQLGALRSQLEAARSAAAMRGVIEVERDAARTELETVKTERDDALRAREEAERSLANAEAKTERLMRKLGGASAPKASRQDRKAAAGLSAAEAREKAYKMLDDDPDITGKTLGEEFGMTARWGELRKQEHALRNGLRAVGEN